jgi:hypothetical protein
VGVGGGGECGGVSCVGCWVGSAVRWCTVTAQWCTEDGARLFFGFNVLKDLKTMVHGEGTSGARRMVHDFLLDSMR